MTDDDGTNEGGYPTWVRLGAFRATLADMGGEGARTAASLADDRLDDHLAAAHAEVQGQLTGYTLTFPNPGPPRILRAIVIDVAAYTATLEFYGAQPIDDKSPVAVRYRRALDLLEKIRTGKLVVPGMTTPDTPDVETWDEPTIYQGPPAVDLAGGFIRDTQRWGW